ncbi:MULTISPECIES: hypothetical protein [Streptomyces]|uniref:Uncharacterized protein n=1 Tax=Streptomyces flavovirens TaxID=52258 RepID=A0ABV8NAV7_9ACTN|nr:hypothetical protein [Streptomyces sp. MBT51]MBK3596069.1 hypothetical protein [Streptomyces sp. MBT51]
MPKTAPSFAFPQDLLDAQAALHETRAACEEYARTLPWSAEPMPGWEGEKQLHTYRPGKEASPGYTEEQHTEITRRRAELLRLSTVVSTHPFWGTVDGNLVAARMALKHAHEPADTEA